MKYGGYIFPSHNPYDKPAFEIYISGCNRTCPGCHNARLADFEYGEQLNIDEFIKQVMIPRCNMFDIISITGGDLLCQPEQEAIKLTFALKTIFPEKDMWLFTGEDTLENIPKWCQISFDVIKLGHYDKNQATGTFPASANQKLLHKGKDY